MSLLLAFLGLGFLMTLAWFLAIVQYRDHDSSKFATGLLIKCTFLSLASLDGTLALLAVEVFRGLGDCTRQNEAAPPYNFVRCSSRRLAREATHSLHFISLFLFDLISIFCSYYSPWNKLSGSGRYFFHEFPYLLLSSRMNHGRQCYSLKTRKEEI